MVRLPSRFVLTATAALALCGVWGCDAVGPVGSLAPPAPAEPGPLPAALAATPSFSTFARLAARVGLAEKVAAYAAATGGPVTVFAPDDEAWALMSPESVDRRTALDGGAALERVLLRHVVRGAVDLASLADGQTLETLEGTPVGVRVRSDGAVVLGPAGTSGPVSDGLLAGAVAGGATRLKGEAGSTTSGPIVRVSAVLRDHLTARERVSASPSLSRSGVLFTQAGFGLGAGSPGTILVPLDAGYDRFPGGAAAFGLASNAGLASKTIRALAVPGPGRTVAELVAAGSVETAAGVALRVGRRSDGVVAVGAGPNNPGEAVVVAGDLPVRGGGRLHVVSGPVQGHLTVMERVDFLPQASTFAGLVRQAGLAGRLGSPGPLTVFVPTEAAFDSLGAGARSVIAGSGEGPLRTLIAQFHVSPLDVPSSAFLNGATFPTLSAQSIRVRPNEAQNLGTSLSLARPGPYLDLPASNGRLHLVSSLLNPDVTVFDQLFFSGTVAFREAVRIAGYKPLLEGPDPVTVIAPRMISDQFLQPAFACRARELAEDHIARGSNGYSPFAQPYGTLNSEYRINYSRGATLQFLLEQIQTTPTTGTNYILRGSTPIRYTDFLMSNGSRIHGADMRLRFYQGGLPPTHAVNLPPC